MDTEEFADFVRGTATRLYRTAYLLTGDHHLAEDLTQSTYAKVFAQWKRVCRSDNRVGYARTMLMNTYLSHRRLRRNAELPIADTPQGAAPLAWQQSDSDDWALRHDLVAALARLELIDRAILVARYWEDRSVAETAHDLGISAEAVRTRCHRALKRLRPQITDSLPERTTP